MNPQIMRELLIALLNGQEHIQDTIQEQNLILNSHNYHMGCSNLYFREFFIDQYKQNKKYSSITFDKDTLDDSVNYHNGSYNEEKLNKLANLIVNNFSRAGKYILAIKDNDDFEIRPS